MKKKMLLLTSILPVESQGGSCSRLIHMMKHFSRDFDVHILCMTSEVPTENIFSLENRTHIEEWVTPTASEKIFKKIKGLICNFPFVFSSGSVEKVKQFMDQHGPFDVVVVQKCIMGALLQEANLLSHTIRVPFVLDEGALHYLSYLRASQFAPNPWLKLVNYIRFLRLKYFTRRLIQHFDFLTVVTQDEKKMVRQISTEHRLLLVSHGIVLKDIEKDAVDSADLAIFGPYDYPPNKEALIWFFDKVFPLLKEKGFPGTVYVVGSHPPREVEKLAQEDKSIQVMGFVDDIDQMYAQVGVVLCPMWHGGGIRSKVLEAMGYAKAVVTTTIGAEGIDAVNNKDMMIQDTPEGYAQAVMRLTLDTGRQKEMGRHARECIAVKYQWETILQPMTDVLLEKIS